MKPPTFGLATLPAEQKPSPLCQWITANLLALDTTAKEKEK